MADGSQFNQNPSVSRKRRIDNLAMVYQEMFTVIERLRSGRQDVSEPAVFRSQIMATLKAAEADARGKGYAMEDIRTASFAVVGFLDESILNSNNPAFTDWLRRPLQEELFGVQVAGEIFFRNIDRLLTSSDSQELADLLEVYQLCLLLGFRGRYSAGDSGSLRSISATLAERMARIRGDSWPVLPAWEPPREPAVAVAGDPYLRTFSWAAVAIWVVALLLFVLYKVLLSSAASSAIAAGASVRL